MEDERPEIGEGGHLNWDGFNAREMDAALSAWLKKRGCKSEYKPYSVLTEYNPKGKKKKKK